MVNPYLCYIFSFAVALLTYMLGWSDLYPPLSFSLLSFISVTIAIHLFFGLRILQKKIVVFNRIEYHQHRAPLIITTLLYVLWSLEFIYNGGIPLLKILFKEPYDYRLFGIPTLHVFVVTFSSFYTIYLFHIYLSTKSFFILTLYALNLLAALLIVNRGMLFFNLASSGFLFLIANPKIQIKQVLVFIPGVITLFFLFGVFGTLRTSREAEIKTYSNHHFLITGKASESFRNAIIPKEFFWPYIYLSSPLANLQQNINTFEPKPVDYTRALHWINNELCWDFLSKRVNASLGKDPESDNRIYHPLSASTIYSRSFSYLGWPGLIVMSIIIVILPVLFIKILPKKSPFFLTGFAILNTLFLFMVFENTIRFTGLSFQLVYPVILNMAINRSIWIKKMFSQGIVSAI